MKCHNNPEKYYKGDEPSPKGRGYCASAEEVGKRMKGRDGKIWVVVKVKNGKRWSRYKSKRDVSPRRPVDPIPRRRPVDPIPRRRPVVEDDSVKKFYEDFKKLCPDNDDFENVHDDGRGIIYDILESGRENEFLHYLDMYSCNPLKAINAMLGSIDLDQYLTREEIRELLRTN